MKKLKLKALTLGTKEVLTKVQLRNVMGGDGSGSGSGSSSGSDTVSYGTSTSLTFAAAIETEHISETETD